MFKYRMGFDIDWDNPTTYNEKLQWLKLHDRDPKYSVLVDKYRVKSYVEDKVGAAHVIQTLGVWNHPKEINFNELPERFVLKTTHGGGNSGVVICKDKSIFDFSSARKYLRRAMKQNLYRDAREWPYKRVQKRIIAEEYIEDTKTGELRDYKFFCFDGEVKMMFVASERQKRKEPFFDFFDADFKHLNIVQGHPNSLVLPSKPKCFEEMKTIASKLSKGIPHVRIDLYEADGRVYFGEMTFFHFGGFVPFSPSQFDNIMGGWISLP
ncbi:MAG: ATP-grasp fold amidoligase family protein [Candidatus Cryptobacteroides sp.]